MLLSSHVENVKPLGMTIFHKINNAEKSAVFMIEDSCLVGKCNPGDSF